MGLTNAMNTGATGLNSNQIMLETIGDNIANVNTTGFKSNRADFETQFSLTLREGVGPNNGLGGVNPSQIGLGSQLGAIQRSFVQGSIGPTGSPYDMAIDGQGFFIIHNADGDQLYTRDGAFTSDANNTLVTRDGNFIQGFTADENGNVDITGPTSNIVIPIGLLTQVQATTLASLVGNLDAGGTAATTGAVLLSDPLETASTQASTSTALTNLVDRNGNTLFANGDVIEVSGVDKGGLELAAQQFVVGTDGSTVQDFLTFLENIFAIHTDPALPDNAGVTLADDGSIVVTSNFGEQNALQIDSADIRNLTQGTSPFDFTETTPASGGGETTSFIVYDSLGAQVEVRLRLVLESKNEGGTTWRFYAESPNDSDPSGALSTGTVSFDQNGRFTGATQNSLSVNRAGTGATDPLDFTVDFSALTGLVSDSELGLAEQDGKPFGTLVDFSVDEQGLIIGAFDNGLTETLGRVAVATFPNPQGLSLRTDNNYSTTGNSGAPTITAPTEGSAGRLSPASLELSNVDLAREFIGLINASTGFSASSRVITTADELLQELLLVAR